MYNDKVEARAVLCSETRALQWLVVALFGLSAILSLQGCLPPDWSFCECDFRDNYWNTVISDVHRLWDVEDFIAAARDNSTYHGKYLQSPPPGIDCPAEAAVFWKGWPQFGMTRGLIEGSMGDLWMPAARDRIKGICMAGHIGLLAICANHFLVKCARAMHAGDPGHMRYMESAYSHMFSLRNLGVPYQLRNCMGQEGFSFDAGALHGWAVKWLGPESNTNPMAAYMGGQLDPFGMLFASGQKMAFTEKTRKYALPHRRPCVPYKDPKCWKRHSKLLIETCEHCCSPFIHKSGRGDPWCWDAEYTYERCCHTDFKDLICKIQRKGEEGGCVDCKKSVTYVCLTPEEKNLQDSQDNYNKEVDKYNDLNKQSQQLRKDVIAAQHDTYAKDGVYREKYNIYDQKLKIWSAAMQNISRISSEARLRQQIMSLNESSVAHNVTVEKLRVAREARESGEEILKKAQNDEKDAYTFVSGNESELEFAKTNLSIELQNLSYARQKLELALAVHMDAQQEATRLSAYETEALESALAANNSLLDVFASSESNFTLRAIQERVARVEIDLAHNAKLEAESRVMAARNSSTIAQTFERAALLEVEAADQNKTRENQSLQTLMQVEAEAENGTKQRAEELQALEQKQAMVQRRLMKIAPGASGSEALSCLIHRTPANASARPSSNAVPEVASAKPSPEKSESKSCTTDPVVDDVNEFCRAWADEGMCTDNADYMRKACPKSCQGKPGFPPIMPVCDFVGGSGVGDGNESEALSPEEVQSLVDELVSGDLVNESGSSTGSAVLPSNASEETKTAVAKALATLEQARQTEKNAASNVADAELNATLAARKIEENQGKLESAQRVKQDALWHEAQAQEVVQVWETHEANNASVNAFAAAALDDRVDESQRIRAAVQQAIKLVEGLERARKLAEERAVQKHNAAQRASKRLDGLADHIAELNSSMSDNMTTAVADWLHAKELEEAEAQRNKDSMYGWGQAIVRKAKEVFVSLIASVEAFLDTYVMDMTDKEGIVEIIRAMEDHKAAKYELHELQMSAKNATLQAKDAANSVRKAETARDKSIETGNNTEVLVAEANETWQGTDRDHREALAGLNMSRAKLGEQQDIVTRRSEELENAADALNMSYLALEDRNEDVRAYKRKLEIAQSAVSQAVYGVELSGASLEAAIADAMLSWHERLRRQCNANSKEFEVYLHHQALLSLFRAAVLGRNRSLTYAASKQEKAAMLRVSGEASLQTAEEVLSGFQEVHAVKRRELDVELERLRANESILLDRQADVNAAQDKLREAQLAVEEVVAIRKEAEEIAVMESRNYSAAEKALEAGLLNVSNLASDLTRAETFVKQKMEDVGSAEVSIVEHERALVATKAWFAEVLASLHIADKQKVFDAALALENKRIAAEEEAAIYENWQRRGLDTHQKNFALVNRQNFVQEKEAARKLSKDEHDKAQEILLVAQKKLEELVKQENDTHENIAKTYKRIGELLQIHEDAKEAYNKQDPEDRKRSFATNLEGSGPDPNGIDVR